MNKLEKWRKQIDMLDREFLKILSKRMEIVREVGKYKKEQDISPFDKKRWREVMKSKMFQAKSLNLPEKFIQKLFDLIHEYSLEEERSER